MSETVLESPLPSGLRLFRVQAPPSLTPPWFDLR